LHYGTHSEHAKHRHLRSATPVLRG
jgi:hypothetical protein